MYYIFLPYMVFETKMPLTVSHCHTILIENVCRLSCKSILPTMFIKMCVKLKHIHLASYVEVEKLTSKVNAALRQTYMMSKISLNLCKFSPGICFKLLGFRIRKIIEPCNSFLAKVRESQLPWVSKTQGESGKFAKKIGWKPWSSVTQFCRIHSCKTLFAKSKLTNLKYSGGGLGGGGCGSEKYIYPNPLCLKFFWYSPYSGRECLACPPPGYQDEVYLAWFSPGLLYSHLSEKTTNWAMLPILVNFTN